MANIAEAVKQAKKAAEDMPTEGEVVEASVNHSTGEVVAFKKPSMTQLMAASGLIPRSTAYLKVNEFGLRIGKNRDFLSDFKGKISLVEDKGFQTKFTLRYGNPAVYLSTYDGENCDKGGSWGDAMVKARQADPKCDPYPSVDILVELTQDVKHKEETIKKGTQIAINTSKTNWSEWEDFYKAALEAGVIGQEVDVQIGFRAIEHGGNEWGVITFELL